MAWEIPVLDISETAAADLSGSQFHFVEVGANGVTVNDAAGEVSLGVLQNTPESGQAASIRVLGVTKVTSGGSFGVGSELTTNASGEATAAATGNKIHGVALEAATSSGQIITMLIRPDGTAA